MNSLLKKPGAWVPVALSLLVVAGWLIALAFAGPPAREADEGAAAHLFQIWLLLEAILIALFAIKWLPKAPRDAIVILFVQFALVILGCAPVYYFHL